MIVRHMWLTGFDAPSMHTMYANKPKQGHGRGMTNGLKFRFSWLIPAGQEHILEQDDGK